LASASNSCCRCRPDSTIWLVVPPHGIMDRFPRSLSRRRRRREGIDRRCLRIAARGGHDHRPKYGIASRTPYAALRSRRLASASGTRSSPRYFPPPDPL
jgi:hypothetical protein